MQNGQTPLAIAQRLGYISVIELLKGVTEASSVSTLANDEKYKVLAPETMQEASMSESEDEGEMKRKQNNRRSSEVESRFVKEVSDT